MATRIDEIRKLKKMGFTLGEAFRHVVYGEELPVIDRVWRRRQLNQRIIDAISAYEFSDDNDE